MKRLLLFPAIAACALLSATSVNGQELDPRQPIRIVVGFTAGGGTDINARVIAAKMSENMGQSVIVENKPGASSMIAAEHVAKARPDGHTLLLSGMTTYVVNANIYKTVPYDTSRDFVPVALTGSFGMMLVVNPQSDIRSLDDFLRTARSSQAPLSFASAGAGSSNQLAMELLMQQAGVKLTHVPYKGSAQAMADVVSGLVPTMFIDTATGKAQIEAGKLRVLAMANRQRSTGLPSVPTIAESGLPGYEMTVWQGIVAPAGTPKPIVDRLNAEINKAMADPATKAKLASYGIEPLSGSPGDFAKYMAAEAGKWTKVIADAHIRAD